MVINAALSLLRTLEAITRPPRLGHDVDVEDGADQLAEREAETECLVPEDFNAVCRCVACVAEEQASAVEYDDDPSPTIVQSAPPPTVDGEGGGGELHSPGARLPHPDDAVAEWIGDAVPVIRAVLAEHMPDVNMGRGWCKPPCNRAFYDWPTWQAHVAPLIANALAPHDKSSEDDWHHREWELGYCSGLDHAIAYILNGGPLDEIIREIRGRQAVVRPTK